MQWLSFMAQTWPDKAAELLLLDLMLELLDCLLDLKRLSEPILQCQLLLELVSMKELTTHS
jgi:hypothetical protein